MRAYYLDLQIYFSEYHGPKPVREGLFLTDSKVLIGFRNVKIPIDESNPPHVIYTKPPGYDRSYNVVYECGLMERVVGSKTEYVLTVSKANDTRALLQVLLKNIDPYSLKPSGPTSFKALEMLGC